MIFNNRALKKILAVVFIATTVTLSAGYFPMRDLTVKQRDEIQLLREKLEVQALLKVENEHLRDYCSAVNEKAENVLRMLSQ